MLQHFKTCFRRFPWLGKIELIFPLAKTIACFLNFFWCRVKRLLAISYPEVWSLSTFQRGGCDRPCTRSRRPVASLNGVS